MRGRSIDLITTLGLSGLLLTIVVRSYISPEFAIAAFSLTSMYCMYLCVANLCYCALHLFFVDKAASLFSVTTRTGIAVTASAAVITLTCISLAGLNFAVLADEAYLVSISQSVYKSGAPCVLHQAIEFNGEMTNIEEMFPYRPLLYPTLIMPLHYVLGYDPHNGLILNALLFFLLLTGTGVLVLNFAKISTAVAMQLCLAAQPLLIWCGMSGGFDLLALQMLTLALAAYWIDSRLMTPASARFFWATLLAFAMARYESPLIVGVLAAFFMLTQGRRGLRRVGWLLPYAITAFSLLPLLWQLLLANQTLTRDVEGTRFTINYLLAHSIELFASVLTQGSPFNPLMTVSGAVALMYLCFRRMKSGRRVEFFGTSLFWAAATCLLVLTGLYLSYWAGGVSGPVSGRFYLIFACVFAVITCAGITSLLSRSRISAVLAIVFASTAFGYAVHQVRHDEYFNGLLAPIELLRMNEYIDSHPAEGRLYAYHLPVELTMRGESAVRIRTVNEEIESFFTMIKHFGVKEVIVFQRAHTDSGRVHPLMQLRPDIRLERLETYPDGIYEFRVSRLTQIGNLRVGEPNGTQEPEPTMEPRI